MFMDATQRVRRTFHVVAFVVGIVLLDQTTKMLAIKHLKYREAIIYWADLFRLQYAENTGAFLGLGGTFSEPVRFWLLTLFNSIVLLSVSSFLMFKKDLPPFVSFSLTLILSGGFGNLIDRVFRDGRVVDFMSMGLTFENWQLRTGIFNIADIAIMAGLFLLIAHELFLAPKQSPDEAADAEK